MVERETELKLWLSFESYSRLLEQLGEPLKVREFSNIYYVVDEQLSRRDWVLRLRCESGKRELTLKIGREVSPGVYDSLEYSEIVDTHDTAAWEQFEPLKILRNEISTARVLVQGASKNKRLVFKPPINVGEEWELDQTSLPDGTSFCELEVEIAWRSEPELEKAKKELSHWLSKNEIPFRESEMTKYARFLKAVSSLDRV